MAVAGHEQAQREQARRDDPSLAVRTVRVRRLGFKYLRKTASALVRRIDGKDTAETFLCHTDKTLSRFYNNRDFRQLSRALRTMRRRLQPMFDVGPVEGAPPTAAAS